jgi:hypothetical protein
VTGTNFNTTAGATTVKLNGVTATASVASATSLSFPVPAAAASGRITATTSVGTGASAQDFLIPPTGVAASDIVVFTRVQPDGAAAGVSIPTGSKNALILFDGAADTYYTVQLGQYGSSPTIASTPYKVIKPDNTTLATGNVGTASGNRPTIHLPKLPSAGTYSILLSPGTATFDATVKVVTDPVLSIDGAAAAVALTFQGQTTRMAFNATAAQKLGLGVIGLTLVPDSTSASGVTINNPDGSLLSNPGSCYSASGGNCDAEIETTVAGLHTIVFNIVSSSAASFSAQLSSEVTGTIALDGGQDMVLTRVGQDARYTFTAAVGDSLGIELSGIATQPAGRSISAIIKRPNGTALTSFSGTEPAAGYVELGTLATAGTYSILVDPTLGAYGNARVNVKQGALLATTDPAAAFSTANNSETARFRFSGTAGQNISIGLSDLAYVGSSSNAATLTVYKPDATSLGFAGSCNPIVLSGGCRVLLSNLPVTGTYAAVLTSPTGVKMTGHALASADVTGTLVAGTPLAVATTRAGQAARLTFAGTAGDSFAVKLYGITSTPSGQVPNITVYKPDGLTLSGGTTISSTSAKIVDLPLLPTTGTYTVLIDPASGITWQGTASVDAGTTVSLTGTLPTLATSAAGEPLRYRFAGTTGQRLEVGVSGLAHSPTGGSTALTLVRPDGNSQALTSCSPGTGCETWVTSLPNTGTYSVIALPPSATSITAGTLGLSTPATGTLTIGASAQTLTIDRPGQTLRYTFSGTAAQLLRINWSSTSITGGTSVSVAILKPDGSTLSSGSFANAATGGLDIASLPSTGTYTVLLDPATAATMSAAISLVTR